MSNQNYIKDFFNLLDLSDYNSSQFFVKPFKGTHSIERIVDYHGAKVKQISIGSHVCELGCPQCGGIAKHKTKDIRPITLNHAPMANDKVQLVVFRRRYICNYCHSHFPESIPFKVPKHNVTVSAYRRLFFLLTQNISLATIAKQSGLPYSTVYRIFSEIDLYHKATDLPTVMSIDEFKGTTDLGFYAFNIVDPITGKIIDILPNRQGDYLKKYFKNFPTSQKKKVKIIIMDMSTPFQSIMKEIFPHATIIVDKFHVVKNIRESMIKARISAQNKLKNTNESLYKIIKSNIHLFDQYRDNLYTGKAWKRYSYFRNDANQWLELNNKDLVEVILDEDGCEEFKEAYEIYQSFLDIFHHKYENYKEKLNEWLDYVFDTQNIYFLKSAKNIRAHWFLPIIKSLTYKAKYIRKGKYYETSYNNGCIESLNNKVKLVKRNAYGFKHFKNFRIRVFLHLGYIRFE